jgi:hypothetical protein
VATTAKKVAVGAAATAAEVNLAGFSTQELRQLGRLQQVRRKPFRPPA